MTAPSLVSTARRSRPPWRHGARDPQVRRNREDVGEERVCGLHQSAVALDDRDLAQQIGVEDDRVLLTVEARQQIVAGQLFRRDAGGDARSLVAGPRHELQTTAATARLDYPRH